MAHPNGVIHVHLTGGKVWYVKRSTLERSSKIANDYLTLLVTKAARTAGVSSGVFLCVSGWDLVQYVCELPEPVNRKRAQEPDDDDDEPIVTSEIISAYKKKRVLFAKPIIWSDSEEKSSEKIPLKDAAPIEVLEPSYCRADYDKINEHLRGNGEELSSLDMSNHTTYGREPRNVLIKRGGFFYQGNELGFFPAPGKKKYEDEDEEEEDTFESEDEESGYWLAEPEDEPYLRLNGMKQAAREAADRKMKAAVASMFFDNYGLILTATVEDNNVILRPYKLGGSCAWRVFLSDLPKFPEEYIVKC